MAHSPKDSWVCWGSISFNMFSAGRDAGNAVERRDKEGRGGRGRRSGKEGCKGGMIDVKMEEGREEDKEASGTGELLQRGGGSVDKDTLQ